MGRECSCKMCSANELDEARLERAVEEARSRGYSAQSPSLDGYAMAVRARHAEATDEASVIRGHVDDVHAEYLASVRAAGASVSIAPPDPYAIALEARRRARRQ